MNCDSGRPKARACGTAPLRSRRCHPSPVRPGLQERHWHRSFRPPSRAALAHHGHSQPGRDESHGNESRGNESHGCNHGSEPTRKPGAERWVAGGHGHSRLSIKVKGGLTQCAATRTALVLFLPVLRVIGEVGDGPRHSVHPIIRRISIQESHRTAPLGHEPTVLDGGSGWLSRHADTPRSGKVLVHGNAR
jgi:hypothetical protein